MSSEQKRFNELFSGTWRGEEKLYPSEWDPNGGPAFGTWVVHASLDGFAVLVDYTEERDGKISYRGHGIHTWDPHQKTFLTYWFDSIGFPPSQPAKGTLDGNRYTYQSDEGGGHSRMTYEWKDGRMEFRIDRSKDGKTWTPMHEGRYTRS